MATGRSLGALLRTWRERAFLTQEQLAERASITARTVRRLESAQVARPQYATIQLVAEALNLDDAEQATLGAAMRALRPTAPDTVPEEVGVPRQLPAVAPAFIGRTAELAALDRVHPAEQLVIATVHGMAGVGKTALAVLAAHRWAHRYPDGQLFVDLHGYSDQAPPTGPADALAVVLGTLGVRGADLPSTLDERAALLRSRLARRRMLILLDDAASAEQVVPLLPGAPGSLVLVTSRRALVGLDRTVTVGLDVLPLGAAMHLFALVVGEPRLADEPTALLAEAVELCGRLPLAVRIAAARFQARPAWRVAHLVDRLRDHRHQLGELGVGERSVAAALDLSCRDLDVRQRRIHRRLGWFPGTELDRAAVAALSAVEESEAGRLLDGQVEAHLLHEPFPGRYAQHDLIRRHAADLAEREEPDGEQRLALSRLLAHYLHATSVAMDLAYPFERGRRPVVAPGPISLPPLSGSGDAVRWLDVELPNLLAAARLAADLRLAEPVGQLSTVLHWHLRTRGRHAEAESLHRLAAATAEAAGDRRAHAEAMLGLGNTRRLMGLHDLASANLTAALALARAADDRAAAVAALAGLGSIHRLQGRTEQAAHLFHEAHRLARAAGDHRGELGALIGQGHVAWLRGHDRAAGDAFGRALDLADRIGNEIGALDALTGLGWVHRRAGRPIEAIEAITRALAIARRIGSRDGELSALIGLGWAQRHRGAPTQAAATYRQVLRLARRIGNRNMAFEAEQGLGRLHCSTGACGAALRHHRQALELAGELAQPADAARAHDGLAQAHRSLGQDDQALHHARRALTILGELGIEHTEEVGVSVAAISARLAEFDRTDDGRHP